MSGRTWSRWLVRLAAAFLLVVAVPPAAVAADARFLAADGGADFGTQVWFEQAVTTDVPLARAEILLEFPDAIGPYVVEVTGELGAGHHELRYQWLLAEDGHLVPNTTITARWRLVPMDRSLEPLVGPPVEVRYRDTRFDWRTRTGEIVRLHWYEGSEAFGRRALEIAETAVAEAAAFLGVTESEPIDFFVYAEQGAFYDALGPATRENVGGQAHGDIRTMFALIGPGGVTDPWVSIVIPHELTHLVFDTAVRNPYRLPPRWLNEGVAMYLSEGYSTSDRATVEIAASAQRLMPLRALGGQFPTSAEQFYLAYAESVSAVAFLVREEGTDALVQLVRGYADGVTDDEAFEAAIGVDLAGFEAAWLRDLGAEVPVRQGPQPAPAGPVPAGWADGPGPVATGAPGPGQPTASAGPGSSEDPGEGSALGAMLPLVVAGAAVILVGGGLAARRRARPDRGAGQ